GGSIFEVGGIKLEHEFVDSFHTSYFGNNFFNCLGYSNRKDVIMILDEDVTITNSTEPTIILPCPRGIDLNGNTLKVNGFYRFGIDSIENNLSIKNGKIETENVNSNDIRSVVPT